MSLKLPAAFVAFLGLFLATMPTFAHHSFQAEFDEAKQFQLTGVLTKVDWINPHIRFFLDVKDADGKVTSWTLATVAPTIYHRAGLTRNFVKVGDTYTVTLCAAKDGSKNLAFVKTWKYPDGHTVNVWFGDPGLLK
jgi:Family of unknown function (DUF6152)